MPLVTPVEVAAWADLELSEADTAVMTAVIAAVEAGVTAACTVTDPVPADLKQAVVMQSARLYKRRNTPDGIAQFGEAYATRVSRFDPDIDALLDPHRRWPFA